jgi:hypothetical protein
MTIPPNDSWLLAAPDPRDEHRHDDGNHSQAEAIARAAAPVGTVSRLWRVLIGAVSYRMSGGGYVLAGPGGGVAGAQQGCCTQQDEQGQGDRELRTHYDNPFASYYGICGPHEDRPSVMASAIWAAEIKAAELAASW